jgi:Phosphotransferase enzyme family
MAETMLEKLNALDPAFLAKIVGMDQNNPSFEIKEWSVKRLSDKGITNPDGLWLFNGIGNDGKRSRPWSVVLKIIQSHEQELPPSAPNHWKRELWAINSGFLEALHGPVKTPRFYRVEESVNEVWIWQEFVEDCRPDPWVLEDYAFAAYQLGKWNGRTSSMKSFPEHPWFARQHYYSWYTEANPERDFEFWLNQKYIVGETRRRYHRLWAEREMFYHVLDTLPQTFSHFDSQRRNLFIRKGNENQDELVLIDWAQCGLGPLGAELFFLTGMSAGLLDWPLAALPELDKATFESYLRGLNEAGWSGDVDIVRLGYVTWLSVWFGVVFPNIVALWCAPDFRPYGLQFFGFAEEDLCLQWLPLLSYSLDCADEARFLMKKLGIA